ncbi:MAG: LysR family transcriptional regulator [Micrococcaceae bacterium]
MDWTLRELRVLVAAVDSGSFTDAAVELHLSQASVSRAIASLERRTGVVLLHRLPRGCELTRAGHQLLPQVRRLLAEAEQLDRLMKHRHSVLRLGYAWAALGSRTTELQRRWAEERPEVELELVRHNSATAGLAEGICDVAVVRRPVDERRYAHVVVGLEQRVVAFAADDPDWKRRRQFTMDDVAQRTVVIDPRVGTTSEDLWQGAQHPQRFVETVDVDAWLDTIAVGRGVGTSSEATAHHHQRPGVKYRPLKDGPRIPVRLIWRRDDRPAGLRDLIDAVTELYS